MAAESPLIDLYHIQVRRLQCDTETEQHGTAEAHSLCIMNAGSRYICLPDLVRFILHATQPLGWRPMYLIIRCDRDFVRKRKLEIYDESNICVHFQISNINLYI